MDTRLGGHNNSKQNKKHTEHEHLRVPRRVRQHGIICEDVFAPTSSLKVPRANERREKKRKKE